MDTTSAAARIEQIEALQDEVLARLEELERRTVAVLKEFSPAERPAAGFAEALHLATIREGDAGPVLAPVAADGASLTSP